MRPPKVIQTITIPVIPNCKDGLNPELVEHVPTKIVLYEDFVEVTMHHTYTIDPEDSLELEPEDEWKRAMGNIKEREEVKIWQQMMIKKSSINAVNFEFNEYRKNWFIRFDQPELNSITVELDLGRVIYKTLVKWMLTGK